MVRPLLKLLIPSVSPLTMDVNWASILCQTRSSLLGIQQGRRQRAITWEFLFLISTLWPCLVFLLRPFHHCASKNVCWLCPMRAGSQDILSTVVPRLEQYLAHSGCVQWRLIPTGRRGKSAPLREPSWWPTQGREHVISLLGAGVIGGTCFLVLPPPCCLIWITALSHTSFIGSFINV